MSLPVDNNAQWMRTPWVGRYRGAGGLASAHAAASMAASLLVLAGLEAVVIATGIRSFRTFLGDPTIYLVYARNVAHGDLFSFNAHQFSSGSTSPLWALVLAVPYALGAGVVGAKVIGLAVTVLSVMAVAWASWRLVGSAFAAVLGTAFVAATLPFWGALLYESPLNVALVATSLVVVVRCSRPGERGAREWISLVVVWALLPLTRPDAVVVVAIELALLLIAARSDRAKLGRVAGAALVAALPSALYFGYSVAALGTPSVSSASRRFALSEYVRWWHGVHYSQPALDYLSSQAALLVIAAAGLALLLRRHPTRIAAAVGLFSMAGYAALVTVGSPVTSGVERYLLPIGPSVSVGLAAVIAESTRLPRRTTTTSTAVWSATAAAKALPAILVVVLLLGTITGPYDDAAANSRLGYSLDTIVQRDADNIVNRVAPRGATVLDYEVQDRYDLRGDLKLLSLDGLTDGKVLPYLEHNRLLEFLRRYRPQYWVAGDAVQYRPSLARSELFPIYEALRNRSGTATSRDGIHFTVIARRRTPFPKRSSGWWRIIVRVSYSK